MRWTNMAATTTTISATMNTVRPCRAESFLGRLLYRHRRRHLSAIDKRHRGVRRIQSSKELASQQRSKVTTTGSTSALTGFDRAFFQHFARLTCCTIPSNLFILSSTGVAVAAPTPTTSLFPPPPIDDRERLAVHNTSMRKVCMTWMGGCKCAFNKRSSTTLHERYRW
jgi:hypothetical protein